MGKGTVIAQKELGDGGFTCSEALSCLHEREADYAKLPKVSLHAERCSTGYRFQELQLVQASANQGSELLNHLIAVCSV